MNEKKIIWILFIFLFCIGFVLGAIIINRYNRSEIDRISNAINNSQEINRRLKLSNTYLSELNSRFTKTIGELEERIIVDNQSYQERLGKIASGLGKISEGLGGTGKDIQAVIDGLEQIKIGLREIEKIK